MFGQPQILARIGFVGPAGMLDAGGFRGRGDIELEVFDSSADQVAGVVQVVEAVGLDVKGPAGLQQQGYHSDYK
jgi:hypothetical protein